MPNRKDPLSMKSGTIVFLLVASSLIPVSAATSLVVSPATNRNDFTGIVGFRFTSTNASTAINYLGFVDQGGDGLTASHTVGLYLWDGSNYALQRSATVSAGTGSTLHNGYRWISIPSITLSNTGVTFWVVTATVGNADGDAWGDEALSGVTGSMGTLDPAIGEINLAPGAAGYYDVGATSLGSPNLTFGGPQGFYSFYNAGNLATAIPETSVAVLGCLGLLPLFRRRR
jgi:hypothetical protein